MNSIIISDALAQVTENGIGLGNIFNKFKVDIDSYEKVIKKFSELKLNRPEFKLDDGKANWDAIAKAIEGCDETALSYFKTLDDGNGTINNQSASVEGLSTYLEKSGKMFNFAAIKATLLNTALNAGIFLVASVAIQSIAKALDNYIHRVEKARERTDELFDEFKQMNDTLADHRKTVSELADRYEELSKGVNLSTNDNVSLSTEEYEEFLDINEQLANSFPELAKGIDENGNSILTLGTKGITAKEQLEELLQTEEDLNNFRIAEGLSDAFNGVYTYIDEANKSTSELNNSLNNANKTISMLSGIKENGINLDVDDNFIFSGNIQNRSEVAYMDALTTSAKNFFDTLDDNRRVELGMVELNSANLFNIQQDDLGAFKIYSNFANLTPDEVNALEGIIKDNVSKIYYVLDDEVDAQEQTTQKKVQQAQNAWIDFIPNLIAGMKSKQTFKNLDPDMQDIAIQIVEGLDYSFAGAMDAYDPDPYAYIRDKFISPMLALDDKDKQLVKNSFNKLMQLDPNDISQQNKSEINALIRDIAELLDQNPLELKVVFGFDNENINYKNIITKAAEKFSGVTSQTYGNNSEADLYYDQVWDDLDTFAKENSINTQDEIAFWNKCLEESDTRQKAMEKYLASSFAALDPATFNDIFAFKNADDTLTTLGKISESIDTIQNAYNTLSSAIDEYNNNGAISIDTLQSVMELGDDWLDYLVDEDGALKLDKESLDDLAKSRLEEMRVRTLDNLIDQVKQIENNTDANRYLISTNYEAAESFEEVARTSAIVTANLLKAKVASGDLSQGFYDAVIDKMYNDIDKINALFNNASTDLSYKSSSSASSAAKSFTDLLDKELAVLDKKMEAGYIDFKDYIEARRDLIEDYYRQGKLAADEYYSYLEKHYKQELTYKDKVINAVARRIDKEIDKLEKQKDDIESYYKVQIDALEKEKTLLEEKNRERQREIDLQKAMYELERARNQRTKLVNYMPDTIVI